MAWARNITICWAAALAGCALFEQDVPELEAPRRPVTQVDAVMDPGIANLNVDFSSLLYQARTHLAEAPNPCPPPAPPVVKKGRKKPANRPVPLQECKEPPMVAVAHPTGDHIEFVKADKDISVGEQVVIQQGSANGVNTEYAPVYPKGMTVLAVRRMMLLPKQRWTPVVYTPYSVTLDTHAIREKGLLHLRQVVARAAGRLRSRKVMSQAVKGKLLVDVAPQELATILAINEHMDPWRFEHGEPPQVLINEILTVLGTNERGAYKFAVSSMGARGLWQLMQPTYAALRRHYPRAGLEQDYVTGAEDHVNAAMACLLLLDADIAVLPSAMRKALLKDPEELGRYLAATYNAGAATTEPIFNPANPLWMDKLPAKETRVYVEKYQAIRRLLEARDLQTAVEQSSSRKG